jgi:hypothetical protein
MANAFETGGYAFAPVLPRVDEPLAGLKPLSFAGGSQSPIQFKPLAAWNVESPRAELIGQGISSGLGSIAQGIQATYKSKQDREETFRKEGREDRLLAEKNAREDKLLAQKYAQERDISIIKEQIRERLPSSTALKGLAERSLLGEQPDESSDAMSTVAPLEPLEIKSINKGRLGGGSFESINLPEEEEATSETLRINNGSSPLANITAPVDISAAPSPRGQDAINALSTIDWSKVKGLVASTGDAATSTDVPLERNIFLQKKPPASLANLGGVSDEFLKKVESNLSDAEESDRLANRMEQNRQQSQLQKQMEQAIGIDAIYNEQEALMLRDYAKTKGIPAALKATRGGYEVTWPSQTEIEKYRESMGGKQPAAMKQEEIFKEEDKLRGDYLSQSKNFQVVQSAWNNLKGKLKDPTGASDMSMIFAYMKLLDPTSTVREGEYATASNVGTIPQTIFGKYNKAIEGRGFLDPKVRESFIKEAKGMYENALDSHKQVVEQTKQLAKQYNLNPERVTIDLVTRDKGPEIDNAVKELEASLNARQDVGSPSYKEAFNKLKELRRQQKQAQ